MTTQEKLDLFKRVFRGRDDAYGFGDGQCVKQAVTDKLLLSHLSGRQRVGLYPLSPAIMGGAGVYWVAADIDAHGATGLDAYNKQHNSRLDAPYVVKAMNEKAHELGVQAYAERSKSGDGCHVFLFFADAVEAVKGISLMRCLCDHAETETGFTVSEIFPKQIKLVGSNSYGNYLNLPLSGKALVDQGRTAFFDPLTGKAVESQWDVLQDIATNMIEPTLLDMLIDTEEVTLTRTVIDNAGHIKSVGVDYAAILSGELSDKIGGRTDHLVRLAGHWWQRGDRLEEAIQQGKLWDVAHGLGLDTDPEYADKLPQGKVEYTIRDIYRRNDAKAQAAKEAALEQEDVEKPMLVPIESDYDEEFRDIIKAGFSKRVPLYCMPAISERLGGMRPGDLCIVLARSGIGKSFLGHSIAHEVALGKQMKAAFFSMEMSAELLISRSLQMATGWDDKTIEEIVMDDDDQSIRYRLNEYDGQFLVSYKSGMSLPDIQTALYSDPDIGFAVIDYLGMIKGEGRSLYERVSDVARELKGVAKETHTAVMCLCQTRRIDKFTPVTLEMGRDSGVIEEGTDYLMGMWRECPENKVIVVELLKNRRGEGDLREHMIITGHKLEPALVTKGATNGNNTSDRDTV